MMGDVSLDRFRRAGIEAQESRMDPPPETNVLMEAFVDFFDLPGVIPPLFSRCGTERALLQALDQIEVQEFFQHLSVKGILGPVPLLLHESHFFPQESDRIRRIESDLLSLYLNRRHNRVAHATLCIQREPALRAVDPYPFDVEPGRVALGLEAERGAIFVETLADEINVAAQPYLLFALGAGARVEITIVFLLEFCAVERAGRPSDQRIVHQEFLRPPVDISQHARDGRPIDMAAGGSLPAHNSSTGRTGGRSMTIAPANLDRRFSSPSE